MEICSEKSRVSIIVALRSRLDPVDDCADAFDRQAVEDHEIDHLRARRVAALHAFGLIITNACRFRPETVVYG